MGAWRGIELGRVERSSPRLRLRRFTAADAPAVHAAMQAAVMHRFLPVPNPYTEADARQFVTGLTQIGRDEGTGLEFAVTEVDSGRLVGSCSLRLPGPGGGAAEIGYAVYPVGQGHGYAAEATRALTDWAFAHGVARVAIRAAVGNLASVKTALAAGFRFEGIERSGVPTQSGPADAAVLARLPGDDGRPIPASLPPWPAGGRHDGELRLRPAEPGDATGLLAARRDPQSRRWNRTPGEPTEAEARRTCEHASLEWLVAGRARLTMTDAAAGRFAGTIQLRPAGPPGVAEIGYTVHPDWRGRGFAARALRGLAQWAFTAGGFHRLELGIDRENSASQRVARDGGFTADGVLAARIRQADGRYTDDLRFVRLGRSASIG